MNIEKLRQAYSDGSSNPEMVLDGIYRSIEAEQLNDFITLTKNIAYQEAKESAKRHREGKVLSPLDGIPVSVKDNIAMSDVRMTCASAMLNTFVCQYDATVVSRLKAAGAVIVGKNNLDEFAMGSSTETSFYGPVLNPVSKEHVPGGSSGGSAAAVSAGHCAVSLGSDTGGSIRQPAAFCNIVGFKPTYGAIPRFGLTAFSSSLDTIGPLASNVADTRTVFDIIRGRDEFDSTAIFLQRKNLKTEKVGYLDLIEGADNAIDGTYRENIDRLKEAGIETIPVSIKYFNESISIYQILSMAEASSNLARYDGIKYGLQAESASSLYDIYSSVRGEGFGKEVKRRIMTGTYFLKYNDGKYYSISRKLREYLSNQLKEMFKSIDYIVLPTTLTLPFKFGDRLDDPLRMHMSDSLTAFCNLANVPAVNLPAGMAEGLPIGHQIVSSRYNDINLLDFAEKIESIWSRK